MLVRLARAFRSFLPLPSWWIIQRHLESGGRSLLDVGCGRGGPIELIRKKRRLFSVGADIFRPYLLQCRETGLHDDVVRCDVRLLPFGPGTFDFVLCSEVLEHLQRREAEGVIAEMEGIARRQVVITVPTGHCHQVEYDGNPYQAHHSSWMPEDFRRLGYTVRGAGLRGFGSLISRETSSLPEWQRLLANAVWVLASPLSHYFPRMGGGMVCVKNVDGQGMKERGNSRLDAGGERLEERGKKAGSAKRRLADMRVLIVGGNNAACALPDLFQFLADGPRVREVSFVGHPFAQDLVRRSQLAVGRGGHVREWTIKRERHRGPISHLGDIFVTLFLLLFLKRRYDVYVSGTPHLVLLGLLLRSLGIVERTVCWTHDYHPKRFRNGILNGLYLKLDEICATRSDYAWDVVPQIAEHRRQRGLRLSPDRVLIVGDPVRTEQMNWLPAEEVPAGSVINSGLVEAGYGFDLLLEALPKVIEKQPMTRVTVTTYQEFPQSLSRRIRELGLEPHFDLLGYVADEDEYTRVVQRHRVGLALYEPRAGTHKRYSDSRAKPYLARAVPVITTRVPPIAAEIEREGAGIIIDYDKEQLAEAILKLLSDDEFHRRCRDNAIDLARKYQADRVFSSAFQRMGFEV
jgi:glycosyltransferase involved in cell wall biosynthesis